MDLAPALAGLRKLGAGGLNLLVPPTCMACEAPVGRADQLCFACFGRCHFITAPLCVTCGIPFHDASQAGPSRRCHVCAERRPSFRAARGALVYDSHSKSLLLAFKHGERTELARLFAPLLARAGAAVLQGADWLVPVPLHRSRLRRRGYNQAALLARALRPLCGVPVLVDGLQRPLPTASLGEQDAAARAHTMRDAIQPNPVRRAQIAGRHIVLIDDVMTSGATIDACARALAAAGAAQVDAVVVARVPDPGLQDHG